LGWGKLINQLYEQWHLDEVFVKINAERRYLLRAVDHERDVQGKLSERGLIVILGV